MSACLLDQPLHASHLIGIHNNIRGSRRSTSTHSAWPWRTAARRIAPKEIPSEQTHLSRLETCPDAIFSQILAFGGPKTIATLATSNRSLRNRTNEDGHWKELCYHYGKCSSSSDKDNDGLGCPSWREYYENTLLVPVDVPSLGQAIRSVVRCKRQSLPHRILIRPGFYTEEGTLEIPRNSQLMIQCVASCGTGNANLCLSNVPENANQALIRVQSGASLTLDGVHLDHCSAGNDYWNGNAAIVCGTNRNALAVSFGVSSGSLLRDGRQAFFSSGEYHEAATKLNLRNCRVSSQSGRGIMAVGEDVTVDLNRSSVIGCAATGIFVRYATVTLSDECRMEKNGQGSAEILPGQSSLFVDRGFLRVTKDCQLSGSVKSLDGRMNFTTMYE